jgi:hypothetical protein
MIKNPAMTQESPRQTASKNKSFLLLFFKKRRPCFLLFLPDLYKYFTIHYLGRINRQRAIVPDAFAGGERVDPVMQRAHNCCVIGQAIGERAAAMRAIGLRGKHRA